MKFDIEKSKIFMKSDYYIELFQYSYSMIYENFYCKKEQKTNIIVDDFGQIQFVLTQESENPMKQQLIED
jgi:hypothetical protein